MKGCTIQGWKFEISHFLKHRSHKTHHCSRIHTFKITIVAYQNFVADFFPKEVVKLVNIQTFNACCQLKGHTCLNKHATSRCRLFLSMYNFLEDTR